MRIVLADDHTLVRSGIRALLQAVPDVALVAEARDGREALQMIAEHEPDIVLLDISMPNLSGMEVLARVSKDYPETRVVILSMHANEEYVLQALQRGAAGYVLKSADIDELNLAVRAVERGEVYLSPEVSKHLAAYVRRTRPRDEALDRLTSRQREILQLIAEGRTSREIAGALDISAKTVDSHRRVIMDRLDIHDLAGLVRYAIRMGLVSPDR